MPINNLSGKRFGRPVVINRATDNISKSGYKTAMWNCVCDCGNTKIIRGKSLTAGVTKSCGCYAKELKSKANKKHGENGTRLYAIWDSMRQRCYNKKHHAYHNYGGRGISVCEEWDDYSNFKSWAIKNGYDNYAPRGKYTLDRVNVNEGYSPNNCRWVDMKIQSNNKRNTITVNFQGSSHTLKEWAAITGIKYETLWARYHRGKSPEEILKQTNSQT